MVSAYLADALRDPTAELKELFLKHASSADFPKEVGAHFAKVFSTNAAFAEIPTLDARRPPSSHRDRSLVRFRAMVQDTSPGSEMYLRRTPTGHLGGWGLHEEIPDGMNHGVDYSELRECNILWAVSVPGETTWCTEELDGPIEPSITGAYQPQRSHKYPVPDIAHIGVQIYENTMSGGLKPTDLVTFVGILTKEPFALDVESSSEVPTLHVLYIHNFEEEALLTRPYPQPAFDGAQVRSELIDWIAEEALGGNRDVAEWILLASIAKVQSRSPQLLPLSLTLSHFPSPPVPALPSSDSPDAALTQAYIPALSHVIEQLVPLSRTIPLSLPLLNRVPFSPESKDEDLHSGALQLPKGTVLIVTEGGVQEGKLVERGLNNISALQEVITSQSLGYVFPFSRFTFPTDIICIILSEGSKSAFFRTDLHIPCCPKSISIEDISKLYKSAEQIRLPPPDKLALFRDLVIGARTGKVRVTETTSEYIQHDFVGDRQRDTSVTSDDLIRRMAVAKLYALSLHERELSIDTWKRAKAFDERRKALLSSVNATSAK